ncbi:MAG: plasmid mobilization relaxosome protein MobC [Cyanobacteriota bacterium]|nr:plasmid mobilization relaxosome protein MobC [Cyanobacteriota bacterium]
MKSAIARTMPELEKKTQIISLRYRPSELERLDARAQAVGLSRSAYITRKVQGLPVLPPRVPQTNWLTYRELGEIARCLPAIGNNLNQIARALNTAKIKGELIPENLPSLEKLNETVRVIQETRDLIKEARLELCGVTRETGGRGDGEMNL